jgi:protoporphyrinogen oxidase
MTEPQKIYDYVIIGGGVTGLAAARRLQQLGNNNFILLESTNKMGGLCRTEVINGHYLDIGGGHVLHSKYPETLEWIFEHIPITDFNKYNTKVLIDLEGHPVEFPIELNLWQLPVDLQVEYLYSYLNKSNKDIKYENFESWIRNYLGDKIADNYMIPYNKKLWCIDISKLDTEWLVKIPKTDVKLILRSIIERNSNFTEEIVSHRSFYYPKYGGFQAVLDAIRKHIPSENISTHSQVTKLAYDSNRKTWCIIGLFDPIYAKNVINTAPWTELTISGIGFPFDSAFAQLEYLSDVISLWEREPYTHDAHWQYLPGNNVEQHREFYIHNFAPYSKPGGVMTDINRKRWLEMGKKWKAGIPLYEHENIYAYPLPTTTYKAIMKTMLENTKQYNLYGLGRWGQWRYFNTDQCIKQVLEFFKDPYTFDPYKYF